MRRSKIVTSKAIDDYIKEHEADLRKKGIDPQDLKTRVEEGETASYYRTKKKFEKAMKRQEAALLLNKEDLDKYEAIKDAGFEGDKRQFNNKKYGDFVNTNLPITINSEYGLLDGIIEGYWEITDSPYVLASIITQNPFDDTGNSPMQIKEYLPRGRVGL